MKNGKGVKKNILFNSYTNEHSTFYEFHFNLEMCFYYIFQLHLEKALSANTIDFSDNALNFECK